MTDPRILAALERLEGVVKVTILVPGTFENALEEPLAALIRTLHDVGNPGCTFDSVEAHRALIALCEAIMGEKP